MAEFLHFYAALGVREGGYSNRAADKGGETYKGISRKWWPAWAGWAIIDKLKPLKQGQKIKSEELESLVRIFYRQKYWGKVQGDAINSQRVADMLADWYVTSGNDAVKAIQRFLNAVEDGNVGPQTLSLINKNSEDVLMQYLKAAREEYYRGLVAADVSQKANLRGWLNRVSSFT